LVDQVGDIPRRNQPTIVTIRAKPNRLGDGPDLSSEKHRRSGDGAAGCFVAVLLRPYVWPTPHRRQRRSRV
jgi:hypothetical protein